VQSTQYDTKWPPRAAVPGSPYLVYYEISPGRRDTGCGRLALRHDVEGAGSTYRANESTGTAPVFHCNFGAASLWA
jgi:hypothetical protein